MVIKLVHMLLLHEFNKVRMTSNVVIFTIQRLELNIAGPHMVGLEPEGC